MKILLRALLVASIAKSSQASCPADGGSSCDFDPFNPHICGNDYSCSYNTICDAEAAGFDVATECCQAPQPSMCAMNYDPKICGSKECPYANMCLAGLAGYSDSQCGPPPPGCPTGSRDCSGEPSNPYLCGTNRCSYRTICDAESAGFDIRDDCCQDTRGSNICRPSYVPVSCGPPGGKQCEYDSQCMANEAGYNPNQCCPHVPGGVACAMIQEPVACGNIPCLYSNQCLADAAGYSSSNCCKQPVEITSCSNEYAPVMCGSASCIYENKCIAELAGFDYNSCVPLAMTENSVVA